MKTTVPTGVLSETEAGKKADLLRKSRLRAIDQGTPYDATGRMIKWARELRSGKLGRCTDVLIVARTIKMETGDGQGGHGYEYFGNGPGDAKTFHAMAEALALRYRQR
jgi:hypothetical protein